MRESRTYGSVRAKAEWLSYSTTLQIVSPNSTAGDSRLSALLRPRGLGDLVVLLRPARPFCRRPEC